MRRRVPVPEDDGRAYVLAIRSPGPDAGAEFSVRDGLDVIRLRIPTDGFESALTLCKSFVNRLRKSDPTALIILDIDESLG